MGNSYLDSRAVWKAERFTQSTRYGLRSFGDELTPIRNAGGVSGVEAVKRSGPSISWQVYAHDPFGSYVACSLLSTKPLLVVISSLMPDLMHTDSRSLGEKGESVTRS
jgi:hypothetical protein